MRHRADLRLWKMAFLSTEAAALCVFWAWIALRPAPAGHFVTAGTSPDLLMAFAGGDLFIYMASGVAGLAGLARGRAWSGPCLWLHAGASLYAGVCTAWGWAAGWFTPWALAAMLPAVAGSLMVAVLSGRAEGRH